MKTIKLILVALAVMSVASCGKDNGEAIPESGLDNGSGNGGGLVPTAKYVKSFIEGEYNDGEYFEAEYILSYDSSNRLSGVLYIDDDGDIARWKYTYGLDKVISTYEDIDDNDTCVYQFSGGQLVKEQWDDEEVDYLYQNGSAHPCKWIWGTSVIDLSWSPSGNLVSCFEEYGDASFTYTDYKNNLNVDLINYWFGLFAEGFLMDSSVFKSVVSAYLPSKIVYSYGSSVDMERFTYKFDSDGYPTEIKITDPDDTEWYCIYKITY
ncbi:MAG: hypothetical protein ACI3Z0_00250 [Candidatus Cryptobacteroides sp.]